MPPGRPPKPTAILKAAGTYREERHGERVDALGVPTCPAWLATADPLAAEIWHDVLPLLVSQGCAAEIDYMMLAGLCSHYSAWRRDTELAECAPYGSLERAKFKKLANESWKEVRDLSARVWAVSA